MESQVNKSEHAVERFRAGLNCAQAVLEAFADDLGIDPDTAQRIACGFGGGIGRTGGVCGAVTGAVMVIGLASCGADPRSLATKNQVHDLVRSFLQEFEDEHGATSCRDLLGCDMGTDEGRAQALSLGLLETRCPLYVEDAVEILETMRQEHAW